HAACFPSQTGCDQNAVTKYEYNPKKAKELLAAAGYPQGFKTEIQAYRERDYAEAMVGYLKAIGIDAKLNFLKYAAMRENL
ncbi:ABC transporter substrate-binding protein, partial [Salmonella enterica]|uniref:ABC transporter substrate-binding protein n=1 Tax=Salmonella enterica TaxID=28901 RepID=UPI003D26A6BB